MLIKDDFPGAYLDSWITAEPCDGCGSTQCICAAMGIRRPEFNMHNELAEIHDVTVMRVTEKAVLCMVDGKEVWIPQSQIHDDSEVWKEGDEGTLVIPEWLALDKGLI